MSDLQPYFDRFAQRLALRSWTLETLLLTGTLHIARDTAWNAVEIRRGDRRAAARLLNEYLLNKQETAA